MPYDSERDFAFITNVAIIPLLLVAHPSFPHRDARSLVAAAKAVGMGRESAYRLRKRTGAAGFAAAWDAAMGLATRPVNLARAKSTGLPAHYRLRAGLMQVLVRAGGFAGVSKKPDNSALLQHIAQLDRHWAAEAMADYPE